MPRDGSGGYSLPEAAFTPNTTISSTDVNSNFSDIASALTASIARDGQTVATASIPFAAGLATNTIAERTGGSGVTVDGVLLKDGGATLKDSVTQFQDDGDATKQLRFQLSGITTGTTRTATMPDADITLVGTAATQTLTNKTITIADNALTVQDEGDATKQLQFQLSGITTGNTRTLTVPDASDTIVGLAATQTLTNKTLTSPVLNTGVTGTALAATSDLLSGTATLLVTAGTLKRYHGTGQTISAGGTLTLAHSLGAKPFFVMFSIVMGASTELGYAQGDEVLINLSDSGSDGTPGTAGVMIDATNITVRFQTTTYTPVITNKSTNAAAAIDPTKWTLSVRAML